MHEVRVGQIEFHREMRIYIDGLEATTTEHTQVNRDIQCQIADHEARITDIQRGINSGKNKL